MSPEEDTGKPRWADQEKRGAGVSGAGREPWGPSWSLPGQLCPLPVVPGGPDTWLTLLPPPDLLSGDC